MKGKMKSTFKALTDYNDTINVAWSHLEEAREYTNRNTHTTPNIVNKCLFGPLQVKKKRIPRGGGGGG